MTMNNIEMGHIRWIVTTTLVKSITSFEFFMNSQTKSLGAQVQGYSVLKDKTIIISVLGGCVTLVWEVWSCLVTSAFFTRHYTVWLDHGQGHGVSQKFCLGECCCW